MCVCACVWGQQVPEALQQAAPTARACSPTAARGPTATSSAAFHPSSCGAHARRTPTTAAALTTRLPRPLPTPQQQQPHLQESKAQQQQARQLHPILQRHLCNTIRPSRCALKPLLWDNQQSHNATPHHSNIRPHLDCWHRSLTIGTTWTPRRKPDGRAPRELSRDPSPPPPHQSGVD